MSWAEIKKAVNSNIDAPLDSLAINTVQRRLNKYDTVQHFDVNNNDITRDILTVNRRGALRFFNAQLVPTINNVTATSVQGTNDMTCDVNILIDNKFNIKFILNARTNKTASSGTAFKSCVGSICDDMFYKPAEGTKVIIPNTLSDILNIYTAYISVLGYNSATSFYGIIPRVQSTSDNIVYLYLFKHGLLFNNSLKISMTPHDINAGQTSITTNYLKLYYEYLD